MAECVLLTGGAGYIGSHSVIEVVQAGYNAVVVDNLCNSTIECLHRVEKICNTNIPFYEIDLLDKNALNEVFQKHKIHHVIHFAGLKAVGESCEIPLSYYKNNVCGAITLTEVMIQNNVKNLIFSSSATVYGNPEYLPIDEKHPVGSCTNPYGKTKYFIEEILSDLCKSDKDWNIVLLRYFNPIGAHKSGLIGEDPKGPPNNLMPYVAQVAIGRRPHLNVFGNDYDTPDGTGVRDFIHVVDLAKGHVAAINKLKESCGRRVYNLGTGNGYSVMDMIKAMEKASGETIKYKVGERRAGDIASCYADPNLSATEMKWTAKLGLNEMCEDLWNWQSKNPYGFSSDNKNDSASNTS